MPLVLGGLASRSGKAATVFGQSTVVANWYVDSVGGLDANNGTSADTPLQTISALLGKAISTGQTVALKAGSYWREKLLIPAVNNVKVVVYGSGASPVLDCSALIVAGSWTKTGGQTNVYQQDLTCEATGSTWISAWESGYSSPVGVNGRLARAVSIVDCDATPGSYFPSSDASTSFTLYLHASDNSNPAGNGKTYEYTKRYAGYDAVSNAPTGCWVAGITTKRNLANDGSLQISKNGYAYNCNANEGSKHNVYARTGATLYSVAASDAYFGGQSLILFVHNENSPANEGIRYAYCTATVTPFNQNSTGYYGHTNVSGSFGEVVFDTCSANNCGIGISANSQASAVLRNCTVTNANICYSCDHDWLLDGCFGQANQGANPQILFIGSVNVEVTRLSGSTNGSYWIWVDGNCSAYIHDCDWSAVSGPIMISLRASGASVTTRNIHFSGASLPYFTGPDRTLDSNSNIFTGFGASGLVGQFNGVYKNQSQWQGLGYDTNSTFN